MSATPSRVDIRCSTSISPSDTDVSDYFPVMTNQRSSGIAAAPLLAVISAMDLSWGLWCRKRGQSPHDLFRPARFLLLSSCGLDRIFVRDLTPKGGANPARSSILA